MAVQAPSSAPSRGRNPVPAPATRRHEERTRPRVFVSFGPGAAAAALALLLSLVAPGGIAGQDPARPVPVETLIAEARSENKALRSLAIQKLGRLGDAKAVPFLVELLEDPDAQVRVLALEALAGIGDPRCLAGFLERFRDSQPVVVATAAREVVRFDAAAAIPALFQALRHRTAGVRDQAARAFERLVRFESGFDPDAPAEEREQVILRWESWWEGARAQTPLAWWIGALRASDARMRKNAAMALRDQRSREAIPPLLDALADPQESVRLHAGLALSSITGLTFGYAPFSGPGSDPTAREQATAAWRTWWQTAREAPEAEWYLAALRDARPENRAAAAARLAEMRYEPAVSPLIQLLADASATARRQAHGALIAIVGVEIPFSPEGPAEERKVQVDEWKFWWDSVRARGRQEWLIDALLNGKSAAAQASAARSLSAFADRRTVESLFFGLASPHGGAREAAIGSLRRITGRAFDYAASAPENERKAAIRRWQEWWESEGRAAFPR